MELLLLVIIIVVLLPALLLFYLSNPKSEGPLKAYPLIGSMLQFIKHRHRLLEWQTELLAATPTSTLHIRLFGKQQGIITANPANLEHVLKSNVPDGGLPRPGITNVEGELWKRQRKALSYEFSTRTLRIFVEGIVQREVTRRLLPLLRRAAASGAAVDIQDVLERYGFDNVCQVAFNEDPACLATEGRIPPAGGGSRRGSPPPSGRHRHHRLPLPKLLNVGSEKRLRESISTLNDFARSVIRSRKEKLRSPAAEAEGLRHQDLLSRFIAGEDNSDEFLRDIVVNLILAGQETTSSALTWFFWSCRRDPLGEDKKQGGEEGEQSFGFDELKEMTYLHAAITEAMRLYPPVPWNSSYCLADDVLPDGTKVGKGWFDGGSVGEDFGEFRPERWLGPGGEFRAESPFRFPAFHGGARSCLGKEMAYLQMKSMAACLIERFTLDVVGGGGRPEMLLSTSLRVKGGLLVRVRERTTPR
ncbi:unnamed protein product [Spirodela intermedia]|uniref:Uncharacterized protein n=1 Tax=Spirodela intermedia TaxID=51605 RepID=A0A7I8IYD1_SPIIN|nr:unnamed protein product [Spirodela intermedia]CAA6662011.1 unnamed protein product [Spirodela intermedia]